MDGKQREKLSIAVVGDGGWGTANAILLHGYGHRVTVWGYDPANIAAAVAERENRKFLPGVRLPEGISWTSDPAAAVEGADVVVLAMPSRHFAGVCGRFSGVVPGGALFVSLAKGFREDTRERMSSTAEKIFGVPDVVVLSGPTHAEEVARGIPAAIVAASRNSALAKKTQEIWSGPRFRVYTSSDPAGVEAGGAVKNVIALAAGASDGLGFGDSTRAALMTRGLAELSRFVGVCGGRPETVRGLSGVGDLIVTCCSRHSRNHSVGERLGRGEPVERILSSMDMVAEGVGNSKTVCRIAEENGLEMPICEAVRDMCDGRLSARDAVERLLSRPLKSE